MSDDIKIIQKEYISAASLSSGLVCSLDQIVMLNDGGLTDSEWLDHANKLQDMQAAAHLICSSMQTIGAAINRISRISRINMIESHGDIPVNTKDESAQRENDKFILTSKTIILGGRPLHQIKALKSFGRVKKGERGGYVEKVSNLDYEGDAWVFW